MTTLSTDGAGKAAPVLHLFSGPSLAGWMPAFATPGHHTYEILSRSADPTQAAAWAATLVESPDQRIVLHADHLSLLRDAEVGRQLALRGYDVVAPTPLAAAVGQDKALMQWLLRRNGVPQPSDSARATPAADRPSVIKLRAGTEGRGTRLGGLSEAAEHELSEPFVHGHEYSVNVYTAGTGAMTFPPVAKGETRLDLVPPPRRRRECPAPALTAVLEAQLRSTAVAAVSACAAEGFAEVEFVVEHGTGDVLVLEVNPRVSGTLRMSAMATRTRLLDLFSRRSVQGGTVHAVRAAVEQPYSGEPFCDLEQGIVATSRITVADTNHATARAHLDQLLEKSRV
ncbi:ATP-grasp domain-containing protein [Streptomyces collinus]|uniref:ATP-grasp domain-containing protein n=1 Tax=Streptomyces collinus TaxID=42684 RepID=UPI002943A806|nr:ATP-grasp domain-containing protein [Streptomyces collinus]